MTIIHRASAAARIAALAAATLAAACSPQQSSAQGLAFEAAATEVSARDNVRVAVRVTGPSGVIALDQDAVSEARIDMGPDGMAAMAAPLRPVAPHEGESLAWETDLAMAGRWSLQVTATAPGHAEPVTGEVIITAKDE